MPLAHAEDPTGSTSPIPLNDYRLRISSSPQFTIGCVLRVHFDRMEQCAWRLEGWRATCIAIGLCLTVTLFVDGSRANVFHRWAQTRD